MSEILRNEPPCSRNGTQITTPCAGAGWCRELILKSLLDRINEQYEIMPEPPRDPHLG